MGGGHKTQQHDNIIFLRNTETHSGTPLIQWCTAESQILTKGLSPATKATTPKHEIGQTHDQLLAYECYYTESTHAPRSGTHEILALALNEECFSIKIPNNHRVFAEDLSQSRSFDFMLSG